MYWYLESISIRQRPNKKAKYKKQSYKENTGSITLLCRAFCNVSWFMPLSTLRHWSPILCVTSDAIVSRFYFYRQVMYNVFILQCVKVQNNCPIILIWADTAVAYKAVIYRVRAYNVSIPYCSLYMNQKQKGSLHRSLFDTFISTESHMTAWYKWFFERIN